MTPALRPPALALIGAMVLVAAPAHAQTAAAPVQVAGADPDAVCYVATTYAWSEGTKKHGDPGLLDKIERSGTYFTGVLVTRYPTDAALGAALQGAMSEIRKSKDFIQLVNSCLVKAESQRQRPSAALQSVTP